MGRPPHRPELRVDPEDGVPRSYDDVVKRYRAQYSEDQIKRYWDFEMILYEGATMRNVTNDPFLTHAQQAANVEELANVQQDPFLSERRHMAPDMAKGHDPTVDPTKDPFFLHSGVQSYGQTQGYSQGQTQGYSQGGPYGTMDGMPHEGRREKFANSMRGAQRHWTESFYRLLGPGDPARDVRSRSILIGVPWFMFMWVLVLWLVLQHFSDPATLGLTAIAILVPLGMMFSWYYGRRGGPVSYMSLGALCVFAAMGGTIAGQFGWERYWRQLWWTQTGFRGPASAETPGMAMSDYAVVDFWDAVSESTNNDTRVDFMKSAGYQDDDFYCVAPILSPSSSEAGLVRVNFWAVGINCCERYGSFTCDHSREWNAGAGVVVLGEGFPCPSCNVEKFRAAVTKAESVHGLVSADGARFVRWVKDAGSLQARMMIHSTAYIVLCSILGGAYFSILGWLSWYYGLFIEPSDDKALLTATESALRERGIAVDGPSVLETMVPDTAMACPPRDR